jgi:hypothetical protein
MSFYYYYYQKKRQKSRVLLAVRASASVSREAKKNLSTCLPCGPAPRDVCCFLAPFVPTAAAHLAAAKSPAPARRLSEPSRQHRARPFAPRLPIQSFLPFRVPACLGLGISSGEAAADWGFGPMAWRRVLSLVRFLIALFLLLFRASPFAGAAVWMGGM